MNEKVEISKHQQHQQQQQPLLQRQSSINWDIVRNGRVDPGWNDPLSSATTLLNRDRQNILNPQLHHIRQQRTISSPSPSAIQSIVESVQLRYAMNQIPRTLHDSNVSNNEIDISDNNDMKQGGISKRHLFVATGTSPSSPGTDRSGIRYHGDSGPQSPIRNDSQKYKALTPAEYKQLSTPVLMLTKAIIGTAILVFPRCFLKAGIFPSLAALVFAALVAFFVSDIVMKVKEHVGAATYRACAEECFGKVGGLLLDIAIFLQSFGTLTGYTMVVGDVIPPVLMDIAGIPKGSNPNLITLNDLLGPRLHLQQSIMDTMHQQTFANSEVNWTRASLTSMASSIESISLRTLSMMFTSIFILVPLCLLRSLDSLRGLTASSFIAYFIMLFILFREAVRRVLLYDLGPHINEYLGASDATTVLFGIQPSAVPVMPASSLHWTGVTLGALFNVLPIITLSYSCVPFMFEVHRALLATKENGSHDSKDHPQQPDKLQIHVAAGDSSKAPTNIEREWRFVTSTSFISACFFYTSFGFFGVLAFRGATLVNILTNLEQAVGSFVANCANVLFAMSLIASYPIIMSVVRQPLRRIFHFIRLDYMTRRIRCFGYCSNEISTPSNPSTFLFICEALFIISASLCVAVYVPGIVSSFPFSFCDFLFHWSEMLLFLLFKLYG